METNQIHGKAFIFALPSFFLSSFPFSYLLFHFFFLSPVSPSAYYYCKHGHALLNTEEAPKKKKRHEGLVSLWDFS